jgi:hypothetical protein
MARSNKKQGPVIEVAVAEVVDYLRITGDFAPALAEVVKRKVTAEAARKNGISVTAAELQNAADGFRAVRDLLKASDTERWLKANGIALDALEAYLETNILISKFKDQLAKRGKKLLKSKAVAETVRELAYREWLDAALA